MVRGACGDEDQVVSARYFVVVVYPSSPSNGDPWFWTWWGNEDQDPIWGCVLSHIWSTFWCVEHASARRNGGWIYHFRRAETTFFHRPNRCAPKMSNTIKLRVKMGFYVIRLYATSGIVRQFRLINVAGPYQRCILHSIKWCRIIKNDIQILRTNKRKRRLTACKIYCLGV